MKSGIDRAYRCGRILVEHETYDDVIRIYTPEHTIAFMGTRAEAMALAKDIIEEAQTTVHTRPLPNA